MSVEKDMKFLNSYGVCLLLVQGLRSGYVVGFGGLAFQVLSVPQRLDVRHHRPRSRDRTGLEKLFLKAFVPFSIIAQLQLTEL